MVSGSRLRRRQAQELHSQCTYALDAQVSSRLGVGYGAPQRSRGIDSIWGWWHRFTFRGGGGPPISSARVGARVRTLVRPASQRRGVC